MPQRHAKCAQRFAKKKKNWHPWCKITKRDVLQLLKVVNHKVFMPLCVLSPRVKFYIAYIPPSVLCISVHTLRVSAVKPITCGDTVASREKLRYCV